MEVIFKRSPALLFSFPFQACSNELKSYHLVFCHALFLWPEMQQVVDTAQMFAGGVRVSTDMAEQYHHGYYCWCCCYSKKESLLLHDLQLKRSHPFPFYCCVLMHVCFGHLSQAHFISHVRNYFIGFSHGDRLVALCSSSSRWHVAKTVHSFCMLREVPAILPRLG